MKIRHLDSCLRKKEEEIYKLRQDNQSMFSDLKGLASNEENYKNEIQDGKIKRQELEMLLQDLQDKAMNQEMKLKS